MCAFNYRFVPAVRLARRSSSPASSARSTTSAGAICRTGWSTLPLPRLAGRPRRRPGSGALGDLGAHVIDLARFLVGEISGGHGRLRTFVRERGGSPDVDDAFEAVLEFEGGAVGTIEAITLRARAQERAAAGRSTAAAGSLAFDLERLNELQILAGAPATRVPARRS